MKKILTTAIMITACAALCAAVWPRNDAGGKVPADAESADVGTYAKKLPQSMQREIYASSDDTPVMQAAELRAPETVEKTAEKEEAMAAPLAVIPAPQNSAPAYAAPYHTDVYPNNVYSEDLIYDTDGNLIGKTYTIPTEFGPDAIWIDGHAFYDVPGFGLIEWSGPGQRTEDYTMYESGVKVGIMGGEDEAPLHSAPAAQTEPPEPAGEVIEQTVNVRPERNSTPPDYKPDTTPPNDPNARSAVHPQS